MLSPSPLTLPWTGGSLQDSAERSSLKLLARSPKGRFPSPQFQLTQQPLHPSRGGGLREAVAVRVPIASFPLPSKWKRQPRSSLCEHFPPPQHLALDASLPATPARNCQKHGPFPAAHSAHTLLLTGEEEVGLSNPSSPSIAIGTASTTDRKNSAGVKGCLTTENHRRLLAEGQDQGRAYGHALHFFSLTNEKKKKSRI